MGTFGKWCQYLLFENGISVVFWVCDGNLWKIMSISSIWKRDFRRFLGLWRNLSKILPISSIWKRDFRCFLGLWWGPLENNVNIFYLKMEFPCFFWLVSDGNLWKTMPISSIWKRDFPFFRACDGTLWKIIPISSIWKRDFRGFLACDGNLSKILPISSIWKRDFRCFLGLWFGPLPSHSRQKAHIFFLLKFSCFCDERKLNYRSCASELWCLLQCAQSLKLFTPLRCLPSTCSEGHSECRWNCWPAREIQISDGIPHFFWWVTSPLLSPLLRQYVYSKVNTPPIIVPHVAAKASKIKSSSPMAVSNPLSSHEIPFSQNTCGSTKSTTVISSNGTIGFPLEDI